MAEKAPTYSDLASKGDGLLVKRGSVWTYPSCDTDRSGTNVQLPTEYVSDAVVQEALRDGKLHPATTDGVGAPIAVRVSGGETVAAVSVVQAGTPEAGTELPPNSRPSVDAGMKPADPEEVERAPAQSTRQAKPEAAEQRQPATGGKNR